MTDKSVTQARAFFSRAVGAVVAALLLATAAIGAVGRHVAPFVVAVDLGSLGGDFSEASAVSPKGLVVGRSSIDSNGSVFHAFVWSDDAGMIDLGTLGGGSQSWATAISDHGVIAGFGVLPGGAFHAFVRTNANGVVDLSTLGGSHSSPSAVNSKGDVVGFSYIPNDAAFHAFLWTQRDGMVDLGTLGGPNLNSTANAISDDGVVVGESGTAPGEPSHAFVWTRRTGMVDLGTLGTVIGLSSVAQAVSDKGIVVGTSQTDQTASDGHTINHAFVWTRHTGMVDIGTEGLDSFGEKINGRFVVGQTFTPAGTKHGFAWTRKDGFVDIGTLGGARSFAAAVSDRGVVVGNSQTTGNAAVRAFVWSPSSGMVPLDTPGGGTSLASAINGNLIVGSSCTTFDAACHATLWKPSFGSHED